MYIYITCVYIYIHRYICVCGGSEFFILPGVSTLALLFDLLIPSTLTTIGPVPLGRFMMPLLSAAVLLCGVAATFTDGGQTWGLGTSGGSRILSSEKLYWLRQPSPTEDKHGVEEQVVHPEFCQRSCIGNGGKI